MEMEFEEVDLDSLEGSKDDIGAENVDPETSLIFVKHKTMDMKDFSTEVRAVKDIERFLERPVVLLNRHETKLEDIVDTMLDKLIKEKDLQGVNVAAARASFFTEDSVHCLSYVVQGTDPVDGGGLEETQNWLVAIAEVPSVNQSHVAIARLAHSTNLGRTLQATQLVVMVLSPVKTKMTKSSVETARSFGTLLSDVETRQLLLAADSVDDFLRALSDHKDCLSTKQGGKFDGYARGTESMQKDSKLLSFGNGIRDDFRRRWPYYTSDFKDGLVGYHTLHKLAATVLFLYFACLLPAIAFGVLNSRNTNGNIGVEKVMISQAVGGIVFSVFGGQPMLVLLTTAPLALYVKVIYNISEEFGLDFLAMYTCTGLWNASFLVMYSLFGVSNVMRWSTRSTNEIFSLFISVAFTVAAASSIQKALSSESCIGVPNDSCTTCDNTVNTSNYQCNTFGRDTCFCSRESGILYLILSLGTVLMGVSLYNCRKSPFLDANKREILADYSLAIAVLIFSFLGSFVFREFQADKLVTTTSSRYGVSTVTSLSAGAVFGACGLGFCLSILFFVAQNNVGAIVNSPGNRLKKGPARHLDLLVIAVLNACLSLFGFPWVYAALPHSPLHVRAMADVEERVDQGHVTNIIVKVRETRLSTLISHVFIGLSVFMLPSPLDYIPTAVLDGLFLFVAVTPLFTNQMFERFLLLVTEQSAYPPSHYIRRVPQRYIHQYTALQMVQLLLLCAVGFVGTYSYVKMFFPVLLILLLPVRHLLVPKLIDQKYLDAMDAHY